MNHTFVRTQAAQLHIMAATRVQQNKTDSHNNMKNSLNT